MMTNSNLIAFADEYARFKNELEGVHGSIECLSQRGLVNALLAMFRELQHDGDPVSVIAEGISVYRDHLAAEHAEAIAAETRARKAECPSCSAKPGDMCHRPNGTPAAESHRRRCHAARQLVDGQADDTDPMRAPRPGA